MAYRIRYSVNVDWVPPGLGLGIAYQTQNMPNEAGGPAQTLEFLNSVTPNSSTFLAADVTALLATMSADLSTQMNTSLARVQGFASGGG